MPRRWSRELVIGIGIGLIIAASFAILFDNISDREIERRARELGMIYRDETLSGRQSLVLLLPQPTPIEAVADILQEGGVIAGKQALLTEAAARQVTTVPAGVHRFDGLSTADAILTKLTGGEGK